MNSTNILSEQARHKRVHTLYMHVQKKKKKKTGKTNLEVRIVIFLHGCLGAWESRREVAGRNTEGVQGAGFLM